MRQIARFCVTAGIALAGAGVVVVTPTVASPQKDVQIPAVQLSNETAGTGPELDLWQMITGDVSSGFDETIVQPVVPDAGQWQDIFDQNTPDLSVPGSGIAIDPSLLPTNGS